LRRRLDHRCCYITRPALFDERMQLDAAAQPELMQRLAALVPARAAAPGS